MEQDSIISLSRQQLNIWNSTEGRPWKNTLKWSVEVEVSDDKIRDAFMTLVQKQEVLRVELLYKTEMQFPFQSIGIFDLEKLEIERQSDKNWSIQYHSGSGQKSGVVLNIQKNTGETVFDLQVSSLFFDAHSLLKFCTIFNKCLLSNEPIPQVQIPYTKFSGWQESQMEEPDEEGEAFWARISESKESLRLGIESPINQNASEYLGEVIPLTNEVFNQIKLLAQKEGLSVESLLQILWYGLVARHANKNSISGVFLSNGRPFEQLDDTLGSFSKYLPVELDFEQNTLLSLAHQLEAQLENRKEMQAFFDVKDNLSNYGFEHLSIQNQATSIQDIQTHVTDFRAKLTVIEGAELVAFIQFNKKYLSPKAVELLVGQYQSFLALFIENPNELLSKYCPISTKEQTLQTEVFEQGETVVLSNWSLLEKLERHAKSTPKSIALKQGTLQVNYGELAKKIKQSAQYLQKDMGIQPADLVAVSANRSPELVITLLAIWQLGAAFVPIDPGYPDTRKEAIIDSCQPKLIISDSAFSRTHIEQVRLNQLLKKANQYSNLQEDNLASLGSNQLAYLLFTSGSTGKPKGCVISHGSFQNYIEYVTQTYFENTSDVHFGCFTSISFDFTLTSFFCPLWCGGSLSLFDDSLSVDDVLRQYFKEESGFNAIKMTPSHVRLVEDFNLQAKNIQTAILGGEALTMGQCQTLWNINPNMRIFNEYGPTEATVGCVVKEVVPQDDRILIGKPIWNTQVRVANEQLKQTAIGYSEELLIGGDCLALGYHHAPELTKEKFIEINGKLWYKSGDLVHWTDNGELIFLGRTDDQLKIRGNRVEPSEIVQALEALEGIKEAIVLPRFQENEAVELIAYYVPTSEALSQEQLRTQLAQQLPDYFIPSYFLSIAHFPLNQNGKINKNALPAPEELIELQVKAKKAPTSIAETTIYEIWKTVLGHDNFGISQNFFAVGGQSLKAAQIVARINQHFKVNLNLRFIFDYPTIEGLAQYVEQQRNEKTPSINIPKAPTKAFYPLSYGQRRIWILHHLEAKSLVYNMPTVFKLTGTVNYEKLQQAFDALIQEQESLRTIFPSIDGVPHQKILEESSFKIQFSDLRGKINQAEELKRRSTENMQHYFDLEKGPLFRAHVAQTKAETALLFFNIHHIITDGLSEAIFLDTLMSNYQTLVKEKAVTRAPLAIQYRDVAYHEFEQLEKGLLNTQKQFWKNKFEDSIPNIDFPTDFQRPHIQTFNGANLEKSFSKETTERIRQFAVTQECSVFQILFSTMSLLIQRYTGQNDIILGTPIANRASMDLEKIIGFFVNILPVRIQLESENNFAEHLNIVQRELTAAYENQAFPFDKLVDELNLEKDLSRAPLFDIVISLTTREERETLNSGISFERVPEQDVISKYDLTFNFTEYPNELTVSLDYNTDLFLEKTIERIWDNFKTLLNRVCEMPTQPLSSIPLLSDTQTQQIEQFSIAPKQHYSSQKMTLVSAFEAQVLKTPTAPALQYNDQVYSYQALDLRANFTANKLKQDFKVKQGDIVAVIVDKQDPILLILLGILKAGAIYLPIDKGVPLNRKLQILKEAKPQLIIAETSYEVSNIPFANAHLFEGEAHHYDPIALRESNAAYLIFTSGSTGKPKGVLVSHGSFMNMINAQIQTFGILSSDIGLQFASPSFDASLSEVFMMLFAGGRVVMLSETSLNSTLSFVQFLKENEITVATLPPVFLSQLRTFELHPLRVLISAGEVLPTTLAAYYSQKLNLFNAYGPTEFSVCATIYPISNQLQKQTIIPIGKPIPNTFAKVLDENGQLLPINVPGELHLGGSGLAIGYLNNLALTNQVFINHPITGARLYKTGDVAKWNDQGELLFLGRNDDQVKVRGYRIEPEEIRLTLLKTKLVKQALVTTIRNDSEVDLVAYFTGSQTTTSTEIRQALEARLPNYMIPTYFIYLKEFPMNKNGKIDRQALPNSKVIHLAKMPNYEPLTEREAQMLEIWRTILQYAELGPNDNFFESGGHSLKAMSLVAAIYKAWNCKINLRDVFLHPTVKKLTSILNTNQQLKVSIPRLVPIDTELYPLTPQQMRLWASQETLGISNHFNMPFGIELEGTLHVQVFQQAFKALIEMYPVLSYHIVFQDQLPFQKVFEKTPQLQLIDLSNLPDKTSNEVINEFCTTQFNLQEENLFKAILLKEQAQKYIWVVNMHHLIGDGRTVNLLMRQLMKLYAHFLKDNQFKPLIPPTEYGDFAWWLKERLESGEMDYSKDYWLSEIGNYHPERSWFHNRISTNGKLKMLKLRWENSTIEPLYQTFKIGQRGKFPMLLAWVKLILLNLTGDEAIMVGSPVTGNLPNAEDMPGLMMNVLPIYSTPNQEASVQFFVESLSEKWLNHLTHQSFPPDKVWKEQAAKYHYSFENIYGVEVHLDEFGNMYEKELMTIEGLHVRAASFLDEYITRKYPLEFHFNTTSDALELLVVYAPDVFEAQWIESLKIGLEEVLQLMIHHTDVSLSAFMELLEDKQKERIKSNQKSLKKKNLQRFFKAVR